MKKIPFLLLFVLFYGKIVAQSDHTIKKLKITILSTMLAENGMGEWGFSALVEADSVKILFDAGSHERTVLDNCKEMKIDLTKVTTFVLSHNHWDHTIGWIPVRNEISKSRKDALSVTHVANGIFDTRLKSSGENDTKLQNDSALYVQSGGKIIRHNAFEEIFPGIYVTGPVARKYPEKNYKKNSR